MQRIPTLAIIAVGRSGTNFFVSALKDFERAAAYFELFGTHGVFGISDYKDITERLSNYVNHPIEQAEDPVLSEMFKSKPALHLNFLNHSAMEAGYDWMSYKVFPDQVDVAKLKVSLREEKTKVLFLKRNRLDTYISLQKALQKGQWMNTETTELRPDVDLDAFLHWANRQNNWYEDLYAYVQEHSLDHAMISYDRDINRPKAELLKTCEAILTGLGIDATRADKPEHEVHFTKQDKSADSFARIANGAAFKADLIRAGQLDFAFGEPLSDAEMLHRKAG